MQNGKCQIAYLAKYAKSQMVNCIFSHILKMANAKLRIKQNTQSDAKSADWQLRKNA